jgi:hypothetical protein
MSKLDIPDSPELEDVISAAIAAEVARIHTSIPATIIVYDPTSQRATVQPTIFGRRFDQDLKVPIPVPSTPIGGVPVLWPSMPTAGLTFPLPPGTFGMLFFAERSVDEYLETGTPASIPLDLRRFDMQDAFFLPGGRPATAPIDFLGTDPFATVLRGATVKVGDSSAIHPLLHADTFEADLTTLMLALDVWVAAVSAALPAVAGATTIFLAASAVFQATLVAAHKSLRVRTV